MRYISSFSIAALGLALALNSCGTKEQDPKFMDNLPYYVENLEVFGLNQGGAQEFL